MRALLLLVPLASADPTPSCLTGSTSAMPSKYAFTEGTSGTWISDGGSDMYDGGNQIYIRTGNAYSGTLTYTQQCGNTPTWRATGRADVQYYTCKASNTWVAHFKSASGAIDGFKTTGNLGADGSGRVTGGELGAAADGVRYGFYKRVHDGHRYDPSVNQLVIVPSNRWRSTHSTNTNNGHHEVIEVSNGNGVRELTYIMWAGTRAFQYSVAQYNTVYAAAVRCMRPPTAAPTTMAPTTQAPVTQPPTDHTCTAVVHQHGSYRGTTQTYVGPMTGEFRAGTNNAHGQASSMRVTGSPGCMVRIYCHAGPASYGSGCWYHSNSPCNRANTAPCHDANGNWEETYTVGPTGTLNVGFLQHNDPRNAFINIVPTGSIGASGDPFVTYKGKSTQVWLPLEKEISLMQCDAWELRGTTFGTESKQWFRSLALLVNGQEQIRVEAKDTHQLAVTGSSGFFNYTVAKDVDEETVTVTAPDTGLEITSATAKGLAEARVHVDLKITQLKESACRGVLPEVWGVQPMSENTAAMLLPH